MQAKKSTNTKVSNDAQPRKRAALGDVSNVNKGDAVERPAETKKAAGTAKATLSKAAKPVGVQKATSRTESTRSVLGEKDKNRQGNELKRPASTTGVADKPQKKRSSGSNSGSKVPKDDSPENDENIAPSEENIPEIENHSKSSAKVAHDTAEEEIFPQPEEFIPEHVREEIEKMNAEDFGDPLMVSEYVYEILEYMKVLEQQTMPNPNYMTHQRELEWQMRGVLLDWLLEVHTRFHLLPETFYLTVNIIDRFLTQKVVQLERLQLVGVTAMFIASKYEEVLSPHITNFVHVSEDSFTETEILSAERYILATLDYNLSYANPMHFMRRISKADNYDIQTRTIAKYLLEISLFDHRLLAFQPSVNAAAAMYLSRSIQGKPAWDDILVHYSGYTEEQISPVVDIMIDYLRSDVVHNAFYKKYAGKKFLKGTSSANQ